MKKLVFTLAALLTFAVQANAMSYEQARQQALFLADKMAYELNLTEEQYEAAYEINLDYLMSVNSQADLYGTYWERRNLDLSYILLDWQYRAFVEATYFYRPLYWSGGYWHFGIYARYPHRSYFYFGTPHFYAVYRGGHSWRMNGGHSWYHGRDWGHARYVENRGMRHGFDRGDYGRGSHNYGNGNRNHADNGRSFGNGVNRGTQRNGNNGGSFGNGGNNGNGGSYGNGGSNNRHSDNGFNANERFGRTGSSTRTTANRSTTPSGSNSGSFGSSSRIGSTSSPRNTFSPSTRTGTSSGISSPSSNRSSFGSSSRSMGSSSHSSFSSPSSSRGSSGSRSGGSSFGGRR